jgi:hypothetical protein
MPEDERDASSPTPYQSWLAFAEAHSADFMVPCECEKRFYDACGCIHGPCPWCNDTFRRPKELGELLAMLQEAGDRLNGLGDVAFVWQGNGYMAATAALLANGPYVIAPTREEAAARLWKLYRDCGGADHVFDRWIAI